jgi:subtilase family serine protease
VNAFKSNGVTAKVDVTYLRASATVSVGKAQKVFGNKWKVYRTSTGSKVALPANTPKLPKGIKGSVDTIAGMRVQLSGGSSSAAAAQEPAAGGTPTRTGTPAFGCVPASFPTALASDAGLYPNQILTAYGIAPLQAAGLKGQGARLAIVGGAPTPAADVNAFRSCFGTQGTALKDPQRRLDQADPRELAGRDGRLHGRARALAVRSLGTPDQRERRRRRRSASRV